MTNKLRDKLKAELLQVEWSALRTHLERDVIVLVSPELDLLDVAEKVAVDDKDQVEKWINEGLISKPSQSELDLWEKQMERKFLFIIISPYVLTQHAAN